MANVKPISDYCPELQTLITQSPELAQAHDYGIDLQMLWDNVHRSVAERIRRHEQALNMINQLKRARVVE